MTKRPRRTPRPPRWKPDPLRYVRAQPRLFIAMALGFTLFFTLPGRASTRGLAAWDASTALYLVMALGMMFRSDIDRIRRRSENQDEGQAIILGLTSVTAMVSLAGIMAELAIAKAAGDETGVKHILLAAITVFLSWSFLHTIFAIHYAHEFYTPDEDGTVEGLDFPGGGEPDYWDFAYYSFVIGTACATADINITGRRIRRITALHCIVAFFFNTTILALMVNIGAGFV
ncbi:MAG: DUF1345 domain-containing protein [Isosphaeraceae bacterium]